MFKWVSNVQMGSLLREPDWRLSSGRGACIRKWGWGAGLEGPPKFILAPRESLVILSHACFYPSTIPSHFFQGFAPTISAAFSSILTLSSSKILSSFYFLKKKQCSFGLLFLLRVDFLPVQQLCVWKQHPDSFGGLSLPLWVIV